MSIRPRTWWLLGGCGCALLALLIGGGAVLWYLWPSPAPPRKPPQDARSARRARPFYAEKSREAPAVGRTVYSGRLEPGRDATIRCDSTLSLTVSAGTFAGPQPVTVKSASVNGPTPPTIATPLAMYEVTIGSGGPLPRPVTLTFTHAPVAEKERMTAGRWDPEKQIWVPVRLTRRSATTTVVETDHLSYFTLDYWGLNGWQARQSADKRVTVYVSTSSVPDPFPLFSRVAGSKREQRDRFTRALDEGGYTDPSQSGAKRYLNDAAWRALYGQIVAEMVARVRSVYGSGEYGAPETLSVYVSDAFPNPVFTPALSGAYLGLPAMGPKAASSPEELAFDLAHEVFHACQYRVLADTGGVTARWMAATEWLMDASAEYAAGRVAGRTRTGAHVREGGCRHRRRHPAGEDGRQDQARLRRADRSSPPSREHAYESAHFLEYMFEQDAGAGGAPHAVAPDPEGGLPRPKRAGPRDLRPDGRSPDRGDLVRLRRLPDPGQGEPGHGGLKRPAVPPPGGTFLERAARPARPPTRAPTRRFTLAPRPGEPATASLKLTLESQGGGARVVVYRVSGGPCSTSGGLPAAGPTSSGQPKKSLTVPLKGTRVGGRRRVARGREPIPSSRCAPSSRPSRSRRPGSAAATFRLEVEAAGHAPGTLEATDGTPAIPARRGRSRRGRTRSSTPTRRPGEHEVRVTLLEGTNREPAGEAIGRVTVPSSLKITVFNDQHGATRWAARRVRLRYEGKTASLGNRPLRRGTGRGRAAADGLVLARGVGRRLRDVHARPSAIDMSKELVVAKKVTPDAEAAGRSDDPPLGPRPLRASRRPDPPRSRRRSRRPRRSRAPETPSPEDCMAKYRPRLDEVRAHNRAQDPASKSMVTRTMGVDGQCGATYDACIAAAKERDRSCRPGPDGTFTQCIVTENRDWLTCANQEIDCCERALAAQCGMK